MRKVINRLEQMKASIAIYTDTKEKGKAIEWIGKYVHIFRGVSKTWESQKKKIGK